MVANADSPTPREHGWLDIRNLNKSYRDTAVIKDVSLSIRQGEFMTLLGASGSGKTTTLLLIAGFLEPTSGEIILAGDSLLNKHPYKRNIGIVFQQYSLFPHMTISENIAFPLTVRRVPRAEIAARVSEMLKLIQLQGFGDRHPRQLSGGQQQRVALARALVFRPSILLMDEPLAALDKKLRETMQTEIRRLHDQLGITVIYVTHDQEEALRLSDRIAIFNHGRIEQVGTPMALYEQPATRFVAGFLGNSNMFTGTVVESVYDRVQVSTASGHVFTVCSREQFAAGARVVIMVRPEKLVLLPEKVSGAGLHCLETQITECVYLGNNVQYHLRSQTGEMINAQQQLASRARIDLRPGDKTFVTWAAEDAVILKE